MHPAQQKLEEPCFSKVERKVHELARRQAKKQLLGVPWSRFRRAYEEYPHWQGLSLWSRVVINAYGHPPAELLKTIRERCPGFFEEHAPVREADLLAFHVLEWVHSRRFDYAKRQGWLDALIFYGARHVHSQAAWTFWEHCETEKNEKQPTVCPSFDEWWQRVLKLKFSSEVSYMQVARAVERYIDWEATALWLSPLFASNIKPPSHVLSEFGRRFCSARRAGRDPEESQGQFTKWQSVIRAGQEHCLRGAKGANWAKDFMERVRSHPRHVRLQTYGKKWITERSGSRSPNYPSLRQWRFAADHYVQPSLKPAPESRTS